LPTNLTKGLKMADTKISALPAASTPLAGTEVLPIVQGGITEQVSIANLTAGRAVATGALTITGLQSVVGTTALSWVGAGTSSAQTVIGTQGTGASLLVNTPSLNTNFASGLGVSGSFASTTSTVRLTALGVNSGGAYGSTLALAVTGATTSFDRLTINQNGIITMSAYGVGTATFGAGGVISSVSDENWKRKDGAPSNPIEMINNLKPGYWYYNDEKAPVYGADRQLGFYAQNVNEAIGPEAAPEPETETATDENGNNVQVSKPWGYYDRSVLAVTVLALQEALAQIESLTARIATLESKIPA